MADSEIAGKASFDAIRYAQLWEDADVLLMGLDTKPGATLVSICSAGDNALAMLTLDPARVVAVDLSAAQIECLKIRIAAYRTLDHAAFLELMGSRPTDRRALLLDRVARKLPETSQAFWAPLRDSVIAHGLGGVGKFERYFRILRRYLLPLVHRGATIDALLQSRPQAERERFMRECWNTWRWRMLMSAFFSRFTMGRLGRDPAFFDHVEGSVAGHVARRVVHASIDLDPAENPYLHWILKGTHGAVLPLPWRAEHFETIRARLDRLDIRHGAIETFVSTGEKADGFNLSDIFEYMTSESFEAVYRSLLDAATPAARLVYWNMMVPRRMPAAFASRVRRVVAAEERGKAADKAFFYSDFVVEAVV
jgi:S-adenosylmethionine-diacylglycerol 3-amino-3-carboxypropyl transferase